VFEVEHQRGFGGTGYGIVDSGSSSVLLALMSVGKLGLAAQNQSLEVLGEGLKCTDKASVTSLCQWMTKHQKRLFARLLV
jgi:hypothetical protein